jgi:endonuclease/exonuclease/phosphatase family metal-dependent hydrolase
VAVVLAVLVLGAASFLAVATASEFKPPDTERVQVQRAPAGAALRDLAVGGQVKVLSLNVGYAGLGQKDDFFMDGGHMVRAPRADVAADLAGIERTVKSNPADAYLLQEVDTDSHRSYRIDEAARLRQASGANAAFAYNFKSMFTPYPLPAIGAVKSGLQTLTTLSDPTAARQSLPVPFDWPVRLFNLKRCALITRIPVSGGATGRELVLINVHLEAYTSEAGRRAQTAVVTELMNDEYSKGNYVIVGGDFNQAFPDSPSYPDVAKDWTPGRWDAGLVPAGWAARTAQNVPTARLDNGAWTGSDQTSQVFAIDGFITSPNLQVDQVTGLDEGFRFSDHNPVELAATLLPDVAGD